MSTIIEEIDNELSQLHKQCEDVAYNLGMLPDYEEESEINHDQELSEEYYYLSRKINELKGQKENLLRLDIQKQQIKQDNDSFETMKKNFKRGEIKSDKETNSDKVGRGLYA